jgi:predicted dehydrogenase
MVRFGILGFGLHAAKRLLPALGASSRARLAAITRSDLARAQAAAREYGIPLAFASAEELCRCGEVDAVLVATPNACHRADVLCALRHRKPVLCEKPLALNAAEAREMVTAAGQAGVLLGVAQVFRFAPALARLRERVQRGEVGRVIGARSEFHYQGVGHPRRWIADAALAGGGPIADVGVHCIDLLRWILDDEVAEVSAVASRDSDSGTVESSAKLSLRFAAGTGATVSVSFRADYCTPLEIAGESGVLRARDALSLAAPVTLELLRGGQVAEREPLSNQSAFVAMIDAFAAAVEGAAAFPIPGEEGLRNQMVIDAAYRSIAEGKPVALR